MNDDRDASAQGAATPAGLSPGETPGPGAPEDAVSRAAVSRQAAGGSRGSTSSLRNSTSSLRNTVEWVLVIVGAVLVALLVRNFVAQSFRIPSPSMHPTLLEGDRVLVNRLSYKLHDVHRGDVVVFRRPPWAPATPGEPEDLIKRVIGLPGETIVARDGKVFINDRPLDEPYLPKGTHTRDLDTPVKIPKDEVFVMGDNRDNSADSRFGLRTVPEDLIVGRAFAIIWPPSRMSGL